MTLPTTTGSEKTFKNESLMFSVLEAAERASAVAVAGAATLNQGAGFITSEALTTAANGFYVLTLTNSLITTTSMLLCQVSRGTGAGATTQGHPGMSNIECANGSATINVSNDDAVNAFNGTIVIGFILVRQAPASL